KKKSTSPTTSERSTQPAWLAASSLGGAGKAVRALCAPLLACSSRSRERLRGSPGGQRWRVVLARGVGFEYGRARRARSQAGCARATATVRLVGNDIRADEAGAGGEGGGRLELREALGAVAGHVDSARLAGEPSGAKERVVT